MSILYVFMLLVLLCLGQASDDLKVHESGDISPDHLSLLPLPGGFLDDLVSEYGTNGKLSVHQLQKLLGKLNINGVASHRKSDTVLEDGEEMSGVNNVISSPFFLNEVEDELKAMEVQLAHAGGKANNVKNAQDSGENTCYSAEEMMQIYKLDSEDEIDRDVMSEMCPLILHQIESGQCATEEDNDEIREFEDDWLERVRRSVENTTEGYGDEDDGPTTAEVWGYSFLCVTIINLCSLVGVVVVPCMGKKIYENVLMFLICLAVGTLSGSALLHLLPEAHGILVVPLDYTLKNLTVIGGIYLFFLTEKILKMFMVRKKRLAKEKRQMEQESSENGDVSLAPICSIIAKPGHSEHRIIEPVETAAAHVNAEHHHHTKGHGDADKTDEIVLVVTAQGLDGMSEKVPNENGITSVPKENGDVTVVGGHKNCAHTELMQEHQDIATVAYMVIFGDGLHNFIDGLTIGAAFTVSILSGVSICIAVVCEEFPHELGDFAILLNSGMSVKKALCYNFLSATMCYLGLVCGILLSENTESAEWIFAIAAGMFLYISLVDMLPEINTVEENEENAKGSSQAKIFIIQNLGLLTGWGIMLVLAIFESHITL